MQSRPRITVFTSTVFAILFFANYAQAQFEALNEGQAALEKGHRLKSVRLISEAAEKHPELKDVLYQYLPVISDYSIEIPFAAARQLSPANASYLETLGESAHQLERVKAMEAIVKAVRGRQIVILNEAHDTPAHRAFGMQVAKALANEGFQYLAIETLALPKGRAGLVDLNFPRLATGSYSKEPVFGDFIRQAVQFGYKLVAYEIDAEQGKKIDRADSYSGVLVREEAQADNIIDAVLKMDPDAKILIFVGYSHATEDWAKLEDGRELGWLAADCDAAKRESIHSRSIRSAAPTISRRAKSMPSINCCTTKSLLNHLWFFDEKTAAVSPQTCITARSTCRFFIPCKRW